MNQMTATAKIKNGLAGLQANLPGLAIVALVTVGSFLLQSTALFSRILPLSALILAILIGIAVNNLVALPAAAAPGIRYSSKKILRLAIIFLGFKLSFAQLMEVGPMAVITILIVTTSTIAFTVWLGRRMGLSDNCAILLGSGISICGASAIAAVDGVLRSKDEETAFAVGAVTVFGTIFMFAYPLLYQVLNLPDLFYALWAGTSIHEVAQVAAAGVVADEHFKAMASTVKMIRVLYIIPMTVFLTYLQYQAMRREERQETAARPAGRIEIPWFAFLFFAAVLVNSFAGLPGELVAGLVQLDNCLMTAAMAGLGLELSLRAMRHVGRKALFLGTVSSVFISAFSALVIAFLIRAS